MARDGQSGRLGRWLTRLTGSMEMPQEVLLDVPRVTMIGRLQVQIENHRGVLEYTPGRIRIRTGDGVLVIVGSRLKIGSIFREEVDHRRGGRPHRGGAARGGREEGGFPLMIQRLWRFLLGYVVLKIRGPKLERFLNRAAKEGIAIWDAERLGQTMLVVRVSLAGFRRARRLCRAQGWRVSIAEKVGLPFLGVRAAPAQDAGGGGPLGPGHDLLGFRLHMVCRH